MLNGIGASAAIYTPQPAQSKKSGPASLSVEQQQEVNKLRAIDQKVRTHERAHQAAAARLATGGPTFQTVRGPDGKEYAVAGEVRIDTSPGNSPQETIQKARQIQAAALAPGDPSATDRAVAAAAAALEVQAAAELSQQQRSENSGDSDNASQNEPSRQIKQALQAYQQDLAEPINTTVSVEA